MSSPLGELGSGLPVVGDECLRGWRRWGTSSGDLVSINGEPWPHYAPAVARCVRTVSGVTPHEEPAPLRSCSCGLYFARSLAALQNAGAHYGLDGGLRDSAIGSAKLWGRIVPHALGFRAEYAYPELVIVTDPVVAELVRRNYGCEVILAEASATPEPVAFASTVTTPTPEPGTDLSLVRPEICAFVTLQINGAYYQYNGGLDPIAIGRWFACIIAQLGDESTRHGNFSPTGGYSQLQVSFTKRA